MIFIHEYTFSAGGVNSVLIGTVIGVVAFLVGIVIVIFIINKK